MCNSQLEEDLAFVRRAVESSQRAARVDVVPLITWGLLTVAASAMGLIAPALDSVWSWVVVIASAWAYTLWRALRGDPAAPPQLFANRVLGTLWFGTLGAMTLLGFGGYFSGAVPAPAIPGIVSSLLGAAYLASSALVQLRWVRWLGLCWWGTAMALFAVALPMRQPVFAAAMLLLLVVPLVVARAADRRAVAR
jgi:hypothetical protein